MDVDVLREPNPGYTDFVPRADDGGGRLPVLPAKVCRSLWRGCQACRGVGRRREALLRFVGSPLRVRRWDRR